MSLEDQISERFAIAGGRDHVQPSAIDLSLGSTHVDEMRGHGAAQGAMYRVSPFDRVEHLTIARRLVDGTARPNARDDGGILRFRQELHIIAAPEVPKRDAHVEQSRAARQDDLSQGCLTLCWRATRIRDQLELVAIPMKFPRANIAWRRRATAVERQQVVPGRARVSLPCFATRSWYPYRLHACCGPGHNDRMHPSGRRT